MRWLSALGVLTSIAIGLPAVGIVVDAAKSILSGSGGVGEWWWLTWTNLAKTVGCASLIGGMAAILGWPIAWACRRTGTRWVVLLVAPAMFPGFLAYSGWGVLRQPGTATGDWIDRVRASGWQGFPHVVDTVLAIGGLALWAAPVAAGFMLAGVRSIGDDVLDAAELEGGSAARLTVVRSVAWRWMAGSAGVIAALMVGSTIPLHLARVETAGVQIWARLDLVPPDRHWQVWVAAWPLVTLAAIGAWGIARMMGRLGSESDEQGRNERGSGMWAKVLAAVVVGLGVGAPMALFASGLTAEPGILGQYWRTHRGAVATSGELGLVVGIVGVALTASAWRWVGSGSGRAAVVVAGLWTVAGMLPGVMVGSAVVRGFGLIDRLIGLDLGETMVPVVAGMLARVGFVAVWTGIVLGLTESRDERDVRRIDGADGLIGWVEGTLCSKPGVAWATGIAMFALAFQEIEAVVLTLWPGGSLLSRKVLDDLHFFRTRELAAGVVILGSVVGITGVLVAWVGWGGWGGWGGRGKARSEGRRS